jgi:hypothetical protein
MQSLFLVNLWSPDRFPRFWGDRAFADKERAVTFPARPEVREESRAMHWRTRMLGEARLENG